MDTVNIEIEGEKAGFVLNKKTFSTGSRGYHAQGKAVFKGKRYQCNFIITEIGSKPQ